MLKQKPRRCSRVSGSVWGAMAVVGLSLGILFYPVAANWLNARHHATALASWSQTVSKLGDYRVSATLQMAKFYNSRLAAGIEGHKDDADPEYLAQLRWPDTSVMARVLIPSINVDLPIFHGTSAQVLDKGAGHLYGTSLPIGNHSTQYQHWVHSVITAHSGIDTNELFTGLPQLDYGDLFIIRSAGNNLVYRVDQIRIVEAGALKTVTGPPGADLVTLITCTPIGINSHRLLVRGNRYFPSEAMAPQLTSEPSLAQQFPHFAWQWAAGVALSGTLTHSLTGLKKLR